MIQCTRLTLLDVSWSFGALPAANHHFPLRNHQLDDSLRRPLVSEEDNYGASSQLSDRQNPEDHR